MTWCCCSSSFAVSARSFAALRMTVLEHRNARSHFLEDQRRVLTAQGVDAADGDVDLLLAGLGGDVEGLAVDDLSRVDGGGDGVVVEGEGGGGGVDAAAGGEVAGLGLDGGEGDAAEAGAEGGD